MRITYDQWPQNEPPPQIIQTGEPTPFATFIRGRNPCFKAHSNLGSAKSALKVGCYRNLFRTEAALYEWDGFQNQWNLLVHVKKDTCPDDYVLWSDVKAFKQGISNVIQEAPSLEDT